MTHPADHWISEWARWARGESRPPVGYSQVQYAEFIARASSASTYTGSIAPEVLAIDRIVRTQLAPAGRQVMVERYVLRLPDRTIAQHMGCSRSELNRMVNLMLLPQMRHLFDCEQAEPLTAPLYVQLP